MNPGKAFADDAPHKRGAARQGGDTLLPTASFMLTAGWLASDAQRNCLEREVLRKRALANLGVGPDDRVSRRLDSQIDRATDLVLDAAEPDFLYRAYAMDSTDETVRVARRVRFDSQALSLGLGWCRQAVVYIATLGPDVDEAIERAMTDRPDFGLVVDTVASEAAEFLVDEVEQAVSDWLLPYEAISLPFSPGYCDWPVHNQAKLFSLLPDDPVGVRLLPTSLMTPRKSIAGLVGVGLASELKDTCNPCKTCTRKCDHRRHRRSFRA
jgi:hypothetical protein